MCAYMCTKPFNTFDAYRVVDLVQAENAGLQPYFILPRVFPAHGARWVTTKENTGSRQSLSRAWHYSLGRQTKHKVSSIHFFKDRIEFVQSIRILQTVLLKASLCVGKTAAQRTLSACSFNFWTS